LFNLNVFKGIKIIFIKHLFERQRVKFLEEDFLHVT
ncbi:MAG: hypothetical protein PWQ42_93, partial [Sulfurospirillum sp.]|nr:hypothetical protein [Sulfurospirillum sp.]